MCWPRAGQCTDCSWNMSCYLWPMFLRTTRWSGKTLKFSSVPLPIKMTLNYQTPLWALFDFLAKIQEKWSGFFLLLPNRQRTLNKLPTELRCRNFVNKHRLRMQIGAKRAKMCKNVYICIYFNWASILHTAIGGWVSGRAPPPSCI